MTGTYEATATVTPGCDGTKQFSFTMDDMDIKVAGWTTADATGTGSVDGTMQCAVCGTAPLG